MRIMAGDAALTDRFVLENVGSALGRVAFEAGLVFAGRAHSTAFDGGTLVRVVTVRAPDFADLQGMGIGQREAAAHLKMALEAALGGFGWVYDVIFPATGFRVNAARTVTGFAANLGRVRAQGLKPRVRSGIEMFGDVLVAIRTILGTDELSARDLGRRDQGAADGAARDQGAGEQKAGEGQPEPRPCGWGIRDSMVRQAHKNSI